MMAALDGEISPEEQRELDRVLETDSEIREEWERMSRVKEVTSTMVMREPPEEVWEAVLDLGLQPDSSAGSAGSCSRWGDRPAGLRRLEAGRGCGLRDRGCLPFCRRLAILGVALGLSVLVVSVIREKLFTKSAIRTRRLQR